MKTLLNFNSLFCFFLFISLVMFGISGLRAEVIKSFPESDFWIVDRTTPSYSNAKYPADTILGYIVVDTSSAHKEYYQLTDTVPYMTVALWNKNKLDLNQSWEFDMKMFFGTGFRSLNRGTVSNITPKPRASSLIADGMAFVLHKFDTLATRDMIGRGDWYIGYGSSHTPKNAFTQPTSSQRYDETSKLNNTLLTDIDISLISPSFAIEFDTEYEDGNASVDYFNEGGDIPRSHISHT